MIKTKLIVLLLKIITFLNKKQSNAFLSVFTVDNKKGSFICSVVGKRSDIANMLCQLLQMEPDLIDAIVQHGQASSFDKETFKNLLNNLHTFEQKYLM